MSEIEQPQSGIGAESCRSETLDILREEVKFLRTLVAQQGSYITNLISLLPRGDQNHPAQNPDCNAICTIGTIGQHLEQCTMPTTHFDKTRPHASNYDQAQ